MHSEKCEAFNLADGNCTAEIAHDQAKFFGRFGKPDVGTFTSVEIYRGTPRGELFYTYEIV